MTRSTAGAPKSSIACNAFVRRRASKNMRLLLSPPIGDGKCALARSLLAMTSRLFLVHHVRLFAPRSARTFFDKRDGKRAFADCSPRLVAQC